MFKDLKKLKKLSELDDFELKINGYTRDILEEKLEQEKRNITKNLNYIGWILVVFFVFPLALMQLGMTMESAEMTSWLALGFVLWILSRITGKLL